MSRPRVIKLGGSLLDWPELAASFAHWLAGQSPTTNVLVVGGGRPVDVLRGIDCSQGLTDDQAHWLAIRVMSLAASRVAEMLPDAELTNSLDAACSPRARGLSILDVEPFLREDAARLDRLPASWDVTSDSIAARVAARIGAEELVLLKSTLPTGPVDQDALARSGYVDRYFPQAARSLRVRAVNLRDECFPQVALSSTS
jgi:aspartokinase-like uncharacterized kinase